MFTLHLKSPDPVTMGREAGQTGERSPTMTNAQDADWKQRALVAERALADAEERILELLGTRQDDAEYYLTLLEEEVQERTRAIRTILDNVTFGLLLVDRGLRILPGFTTSCWTLFGRMFTPGDRLADIVDLDQRTASTLALLTDQLFEDIVPENVTLQQLRQRFTIGKRILSLEGKVIRDHQGRVDQLLITVSDVTALERAQREARSNHTLITILSRRAAFARFVDDFRISLEEASAQCDEAGRRRLLHTVKGNSASWGLDDVEAVVHELEAQDTIEDEDVLRVQAALETYLDQHHQIIGIRYRDTPSTTRLLEVTTLRHLHRLLEDLRPSPPERELRNWATNVSLVPAAEMLGPLDVFTERLAARLGKDVELRFTGQETLVDPEELAPILQNLTHLIRNAVDHGIEPPSARGQKPRRGLVEVRVDSTPEYIEVEVSDDGRGIDVASLSRKALSEGYCTRSQLASWSEQEKLELIFRDGLSSAASATKVSGRGVGMAAVRSAARRRAGEIRIRSTPGEGTSIIVHIPKPNAVRRVV